MCERGVDEDAALAREPAQATRQVRVHPVAAELIDGQQEDKPRSAVGIGCRQAGSGKPEQCDRKDARDR